MDLTFSPLIFHPKILRSVVKYMDLSNHFFSTSEKLWICKNFTYDQSERSSRQLERNMSIFCTRYSIRVIVLKEWISSYQNGLFMSSGYCQLDDTLLDPQATSKFHSYLQDAWRMSDCDFIMNCTKYLDILSYESSERRASALYDEAFN